MSRDEIDIHPEIKKYWEKQDYKIKVNYAPTQYVQNGIIWQAILIDKSNPIYFTTKPIAFARIDDLIKVYFWEKYKWGDIEYSEEKMLRLIKLESFI